MDQTPDIKKATQQSQRGKNTQTATEGQGHPQDTTKKVGADGTRENKSGTSSTRTARTNRANKLPIRGQQVQLGHIFERGNTGGLLHLTGQGIPNFGSNAFKGFRI